MQKEKYNVLKASEQKKKVQFFCARFTFQTTKSTISNALQGILSNFFCSI